MLRGRGARGNRQRRIESQSTCYLARESLTSNKSLWQSIGNALWPGGKLQHVSVWTHQRLLQASPQASPQALLKASPRASPRALLQESPRAFPHAPIDVEIVTRIPSDVAEMVVVSSQRERGCSFSGGQCISGSTGIHKALIERPRLLPLTFRILQNDLHPLQHHGGRGV